MTAYLDGQLVIADNLLVTGNVNLLGGGQITTTTNGDLVLLPAGSGMTKIGSGSPNKISSPTGDDLYVTDKFEVDGTTWHDGAIVCGGDVTVLDNVSLAFGTSKDAEFRWSGAQTNDGLVFGTGNASRYLILCENADIATDFGVANKNNPTFIIQSSDATAPAQRVLYCHDQTDGVAETETGDYLIKTPAQKTLRLGTSVWDDLRVPLLRGLIGASNPPTLSQFMDDGAASVGVFAYAFADQAVAGNEEQLWFVAQLPHTYKEGTDIEAHIHWTPAVSGGANEFVKWGLEYTWANIDGTFGNTTIITSDATSAATATTSGDTTLTADKHYMTELGTITGTSKTISSMLICRVFRNSSDASDDLAQDAFGFEIDFHHEIDTMGSRQEGVK